MKTYFHIIFQQDCLDLHLKCIYAVYQKKKKCKCKAKLCLRWYIYKNLETYKCWAPKKHIY